MTRSQSTQATRTFVAPRLPQPSSSSIAGDIIQRSVANQPDGAERVCALRGVDTARVIMESPFVSLVVYSVLDGYRLIIAHQRRHFEQARQVLETPGLPAQHR